MATIIGIRPSSFTGNDGQVVTGKNIYLTEPLEQGEGLSADRVFVTDAKINKWTYKPKVGDQVTVLYNRFGKCDSIVSAQF